MKKLFFLFITLFISQYSKSQTVDWTWVDLTGCVDSVKVLDASNNVLGMSTSCCGAAICITGIPASFLIFEGSNSYTVFMNIGPQVNCDGTNGTCSSTDCGFGKFWTTTLGPGGTICGTGGRILTLSITLFP